MRDIHNSQCLLNVEYSGATCSHVTIQFGDTKDDVGLGLVKEGLVMVDVRKEKHLQKMVSEEMRYTVGDGRAVLDKAISSLQFSFGSPKTKFEADFEASCAVSLPG